MCGGGVWCRRAARAKLMLGKRAEGKHRDGPRLIPKRGVSSCVTCGRSVYTRTMQRMMILWTTLMETSVVGSAFSQNTFKQSGLRTPFVFSLHGHLDSKKPYRNLIRHSYQDLARMYQLACLCSMRDFMQTTNFFDVLFITRSTLAGCLSIRFLGSIDTAMVMNENWLSYPTNASSSLYVVILQSSSRQSCVVWCIICYLLC